MNPLILLNVLLLAMLPIYGAYPQIVAAVSEAGLNKVSGVGLDRFNEEFRKGYDFKDYTGTVGSVIYTIHNSTYYQHDMQPSQIISTFNEGQGAISMKWANLSGSALMMVDYEITPAKGNAFAFAEYAGAYAQVTMTFKKGLNGGITGIEAGDLVLTNDQVTVTFNGTDIEPIKAPLTPVIVNIIVTEAIAYMHQFIVNENNYLNAALANMSLDYQVYRSVYEHFELLEDPIAKSNHYIVKLSAFAFNINQTNGTNQTVVETKELPNFDPNVTKDVQLFMSEPFIQNIIDTLFASGSLVYSYTTTFIGRIITLTCYPTKSPSFIINNKLNINGSGQCDLSYLGPNNKYNFAIAYDVMYELTMTIKNSTIFFNVNTNSSGLSSIRFISSVPTELIWIKAIFNTLFRVVTNALNNYLGRNGINIEMMLPENATITNIERHYMENYVATYFDFKTNTPNSTA